AAIRDWDARGIAVYEALTATARTSQADTIAALQAAGFDYSAKWITNAIIVRDGTLELARQLAESSEVLEIRETVVYELIEPVTSMTTTDLTPNAVEWGIQDINADDVWGMGYTGEGITVANIDTGVQ